MTLQEKIAEYGPAVPDAGIVAALNAPDPALPHRRVDIATADVRELLLARGDWAAVVLAAEGAEPAQIRAAAILLRDTIQDTTLIRATEPAIYDAAAGLLQNMVLAGVLTAATRDAIIALADRPQSWAEANGVEVTARSVALARGAN